MVKRALVGSLLVTFAIACKPDFPERQSDVAAPRILAVRSDPAEVKPGDGVHYSVLVATPNGSVTNAAIDFAYCTRPKPLKELNDVSTDCFYPPEDAPDYVVELGVGPDASGALPRDACRNFGSDVPAPQPGQPSGRPTDPDSTGGYYQPLRLVLADIKSLGETRVSCDLPDATREVLVDFRKRYHVNENPQILGTFALLEQATALTPEGDPNPLVLPAGRAITLRVGWPQCPTGASCGDGFCNGDEDVASCAADCTNPVGCTGAEAYVSYDLATRTVIDRRESMRVSWFASGGSFSDDRTGRDEMDMGWTSDDTWTTPSTPGLVHLWVVLRDARGGVDWQSYDVQVQ